MTDADYFAEHPTPRMLAAESRREIARLLDAGSFGTPGARVMRARGGRDAALTGAEQDAVNEEKADLERALTPPWRRDRS